MKKTFAQIFLILIIFLMASSYCYAAINYDSIVQNEDYRMGANDIAIVNSGLLDGNNYYFVANFSGATQLNLSINGESISKSVVLVEKGKNGKLKETTLAKNENGEITFSKDNLYYVSLPEAKTGEVEFVLGDGSSIDDADDSILNDSEEDEVEEDEEDEFKKYRTQNPFEQIITEFFLSMGDYAQDYLSQVLKEEITIDKIVYNKVPMLNANFFNNTTNSATSNASDIVRQAINKWFEFFKGLALVVILVGLVAAGLKMILGTAQGKASAFEILKKIIMGVALVFLFPYVMRYAFDLNEALIQKIYNSTHSVTTSIGASISPISDFQVDEIEERSPQYVSKLGLSVSAGSEEATKMYLNKVETYAQTADMMRIMRAFAGVTERFMYVILWYIMLAQTYILASIYIKRYIIIAFLTAIYPLVIVGYIAGTVFGEDKNNAFNKWCGNYFKNIFLQSIHAITYGVISGVIMAQLREAISPENGGVNNLNWLVMIIAVSFLFSGEKILARLWRASTTAADRGGIKNALGKARGMLGKVMGR